MIIMNLLETRMVGEIEDSSEYTIWLTNKFCLQEKHFYPTHDESRRVLRKAKETK